jgi:hypothetical protein
MTRLTTQQQVELARATFSRKVVTPSHPTSQPQSKITRHVRLNLRGVRIEGDEEFRRTIYEYLKLLNASEEGTRVWNMAGVQWIGPARGVVSWGGSGSIEINTGVAGYGVFCHELRHCWQTANGLEIDERDANLWQAARCAEAGHGLGALIGGFMAFDPLTAAINGIISSGGAA